MNDCPNPMKVVKIGRWFITYQMAVLSWGDECDGAVTRHILAIDLVAQGKVRSLRIVVLRLMFCVGRWPY